MPPSHINLPVILTVASSQSTPEIRRVAPANSAKHHLRMLRVICENWVDQIVIKPTAFDRSALNLSSSALSLVFSDRLSRLFLRFRSTDSRLLCLFSIGLVSCTSRPFRCSLVNSSQPYLPYLFLFVFETIRTSFIDFFRIYFVLPNVFVHIVVLISTFFIVFCGLWSSTSIHAKQDRHQLRWSLISIASRCTERNFPHCMLSGYRTWELLRFGILAVDTPERPISRCNRILGNRLRHIRPVKNRLEIDASILDRLVERFLFLIKNIRFSWCCYNALNRDYCVHFFHWGGVVEIPA